MPLYEYKCKKCGHVFEVFQSMNADGKDLACPHCQAENPEKIFSVFASSGNTPNYGSSSGSGCGSGGFT